MQHDELLDRCLQKMKIAGFDRVQLELDESEKHELSQQHSEINLLRTGFNTSLHIVGIRDCRRASLSLNKLDDESLDQAVLDLTDMANGSPQDEAYDIAPNQHQQAFNLGASEVDAELMYDRMSAFIEYTRHHHPTIIMEESVIDFTLNKGRIVNSQGVNFSVNQGVYNAYAMFTAKSGSDTSSFNYSGFSSTTLDKEIQDEAYLAELLKQSEEQIKTRQITKKFSGDLVITPHAMEDFIGFLSSNISDGQMIAGTSIYKDAINSAVTSPLITLHCHPRSNDLASAYPITGDGIVAEDMTLVKEGILQTYLLSQFGANKTGLALALNDGDCMLMNAGDTELDDLIGGVEKGILLGRFSGGRPNDKGDFSGVAKNSYYIENGKILYPVSETMVSGNIASVLMDVNAVSRQRVEFGDSIFPWIRSPGLVIS